jgi:medium-chain acyl-[acyl-carrier-protein] hydrolase
MTITVGHTIPTVVPGNWPSDAGSCIPRRIAPAVHTPWLAYHRPLSQARLRLFCFHHAGGAASIFRPWAARLQPYEIELCPVQLPGREARINEQPYRDLKPLVDQLAKVLAPYTDRPFALLGHSMGGLIAFYLAQHFQQRARHPQRLIVSATTPPRGGQPQAPIHQLPDGAFLAEVGRFNGLPAELLQNRELLALHLPTLRADFALCEGASALPAAVLHCPLSVYTGLHDHTIGEQVVERWRQQTIGAVQVRKFPGDHFFLFKQPALVIRALVQDLFTVGL